MESNEKWQVELWQKLPPNFQAVNPDIKTKQRHHKKKKILIFTEYRHKKISKC